MTIQITIVGLGQIGASVGLALADRQASIHRVGHDRDYKTARKAVKMGAVDRAAINLPSAVRKADLVLLAVPMDQIRETLDIIAQDIKEDAVVMDTGPVKEVVAAWAGELLPSNRHYVGLTPVINPAYLRTSDYGLDAAHADLFQDGLIAIVAPARTASDAIKLASDFTHLLGATPFFADPAEMDGLMAATHILPQLMAAALLDATLDKPGWREARKIAGRAFTEVTSPTAYLSEPQTLRSSSLLNRENVLRVVDSVIASLQSLRGDIENQDGPALESRLERARRGREHWWRQRLKADWASDDAGPRAEIPGMSDFFGRFLGIGRKPKPK